jgi:hypothetical protein
MPSLAEGTARLKRQVQTPGAAFPLDSTLIEQVTRAVGHRGRACFWTPAVTFLTFLRQILMGNCSCRQTVAWTVSQSAASDAGWGGPPRAGISGDPSAYAQARSRLPLAWFAELHRRVTDGLHSRGGPQRLWCGRRVFLVDGSTARMPDTPSLQNAFPQPERQKPGCGFPAARLTAVFGWTSGTLLDLAMDHLHVQELPLLRRMLPHFQPQDVIVGDRILHSYCDCVTFTRHGLDLILRLNEAARPSLRTRRRLPRKERIVHWHRPRNRPRHLSRSQWADMPDTMTVRQVRVVVRRTGFRSRRIELLTTLLDPQAYPGEKIAQLYRDRWQAELNLRSLKTTLRMEALHGRSPEMVRKEVLMYAITYNLIRGLMAEAARRFGANPLRLSFAGGQQRVAAMLPIWELCRTRRERRNWLDHLLEYMAADRVPDRPDRIEPRAVKRRPKSYVPLSIPRDVFRERLIGRYAA